MTLQRLVITSIARNDLLVVKNLPLKNKRFSTNPAGNYNQINYK